MSRIWVKQMDEVRYFKLGELRKKLLSPFRDRAEVELHERCLYS